MYWWIDLSILLFISAAGILGYKRGSVKIVQHFLKFSISIIGAYLIYPLFTGVIKNYTPLFDIFKNNMEGLLNLPFVPQYEDLEVQRNFIQNLLLPRDLKKQLLYNNNEEIYSILNAKSLTEYIYGFLANSMLNILVMAICFIFISAAVYLILHDFDFFSRWKVKNMRMSKTLGSILGGSMGFIYIQLLMVLFFSFWGLFQEETIFLSIQKSFILKYVYQQGGWISFVTKINY